MSLNHSFIAELQQEAASTRKMLERVPVSKNDWKPHAKSMMLGRLAMHVAELPGWVTLIMSTDELDFTKFDYKPVMAETAEQLLAKHDDDVEQAVAILELSKDEDFDKMWTLRTGEHVHFTLPKKVAMRTYAMSHLYHHRGQMSVYLRLLDIAVPGVYGPTADDMPAAVEEALAATN